MKRHKMKESRLRFFLPNIVYVLPPEIAQLRTGAWCGAWFGNVFSNNPLDFLAAVLAHLSQHPTNSFMNEVVWIV